MQSHGGRQGAPAVRVDVGGVEDQPGDVLHDNGVARESERVETLRHEGRQLGVEARQGEGHHRGHRPLAELGLDLLRRAPAERPRREYCGDERGHGQQAKGCLRDGHCGAAGKLDLPHLGGEGEAPHEVGDGERHGGRLADPEAVAEGLEVVVPHGVCGRGRWQVGSALRPALGVLVAPAVEPLLAPALELLLLLLGQARLAALAPALAARMAPVLAILAILAILTIPATSPFVARHLRLLPALVLRLVVAAASLAASLDVRSVPAATVIVLRRAALAVAAPVPVAAVVVVRLRDLNNGQRRIRVLRRAEEWAGAPLLERELDQRVRGGAAAPPAPALLLPGARGLLLLHGGHRGHHVHIRLLSVVVAQGEGKRHLRRELIQVRVSPLEIVVSSVRALRHVRHDEAEELPPRGQQGQRGHGHQERAHARVAELCARLVLCT
mmetsp:Transcript_8527/g.25087  ORF Transcript_8527/g.25087 Transcript_8527/m.25087 type:complete len:441 (-) Transcript_8527:1259-2581(-)